MAKPSVIRLRGVRHNNLKNFDLDLPIGKLVVVTGLSGSGKSSLAFDTLFAEGQRRYIETFSPYARQFFDRMDKPQVDSIEGIPPAIAIEQRNSVKTTRSTVGTMTEITEYAKLIWANLAQLHCRSCGNVVRKDSPQWIWEEVTKRDRGDILVTFEVPLSEKLSLADSLGLISKQGYSRLLVSSQIIRLEDAAMRLSDLSPNSLVVVQDRIKPTKENRSRFVEACEQAYHFGKGKLKLHFVDAQGIPATSQSFSNRRHCAECDIDYREPSPALFSFNHPIGACPTCRGFGRTITIDYNLAIPDRSKTLAGGAVKPWQTGQGAESQQDLTKFCRLRHVPMNVPFEQLSKNFQDWVINGDPGYGENGVEWPRAWYGIKGYFRWLESKAYKMHVRVLLSRYRSYVTCPTCQGTRFQPETLLYKLSNGDRGLTLSDFYLLSLKQAMSVIDGIAASRKSAKASDPLTLALNELRQRLAFLNEVGLGYLTLDRPTRSLSGGETERVNLTTCLGSGLVNTLFILDEPSVGLHARDTDRLIKILQRLRDAGNTVVVVEHEPSVMRAADQIIDIGPGHGETGGEVVFQGTYKEILKHKRSLTGNYLSGAKSIALPQRRTVDDAIPHLTIENASAHNLKDISVSIPLSRFVCLTGVSGSGKTTLVRDVLLPKLETHLKASGAPPTSTDESRDDDEGETTKVSSAKISGWENIGRVLLVDQSAIGKTPRSNPAVYIGAFDDVRELFAQTELAKQRGLNGSAFSFNSGQGQCERCRGAGFEKIEMQFLSDVFIRCPACNGRRYRPHILEIKATATVTGASGKSETLSWSIADLLEASADEAVRFVQGFSNSRHAQRAADKLKLLQDVGLGYVRLGQPINTLSGGESQRLKLVSHLAEFQSATLTTSDKPSLFLFDEPTTGLHFDDVRVLLNVFQRLVDAGHSVLVIEHNLDLIKCADWVIDLGPDAGSDGGEVVVTGTPEEAGRIPNSHTGTALRPLFITSSTPSLQEA